MTSQLLLVCLPTGERVLTQRRKDAEAQSKLFGVRREAKRHAALEALSAVESGVAAGALPPQSKILASLR
jgi:hypothetical protein